MNSNFYIKLHDRFFTDETRKIIGILDRLSTGYVFFSFPLMLVYLYFSGYENLMRLVLVTLSSFILVTLARKVLNRKRPYEVLGMEPVLEKDTKGQSFPSRHVFSAFVIATSCIRILPLYAVTVFIAGAAIMIIRVIGTVHFVSDVLAGMITGIIAGLVMYI